jgi:hypothetical protein
MSVSVREYYEAYALGAALPIAEVPPAMYGQPIAIYGPEHTPISVAVPAPDMTARVTNKYGCILGDAGRFVLSVLQNEYPRAVRTTPQKYAWHNENHVRNVIPTLLTPNRIVRGVIKNIYMRAVTRDQADGPALRKVFKPNPELERQERSASQAYFLLWSTVVPGPGMDRMTAGLCVVAGDVDAKGRLPIIWPRYIGRLLSHRETTDKREHGLFDI